MNNLQKAAKGELKVSTFKISPKFLSLKKDEQHKIIYEKRKEILNYAINNTDVEMEYIHSNTTSNYILNKVKEEYGD